MAAPKKLKLNNIGKPDKAIAPSKKPYTSKPVGLVNR